jgi:benzoyl-CoA reductase subunit A
MVREAQEMTQEYWRWPETKWTSTDIDWRKAQIITAGIDVGTTSSQAAIFCDDRLFGFANLRTGWNFRDFRQITWNKRWGLRNLYKDIARVVGTGFRSQNISMAQKTVDEIHCQAPRGPFYVWPGGENVGFRAQTCKAIRLYD